MTIIALIALLAYFIGSVPVGYITGRIAGIDVRKHGSGNIGATNVLRVMGKKYGYPVFFADVLKGFAAVRFAYWLAARESTPLLDAEYYGVVAAVAVIIGHTFPVWLRFKGGKGVATSAGAVLGLMPLAAIIIFVVWVIVFELTRYVSLASIIAAAGLPFLVLALLRLRITSGIGVLYFASVMSLLILWRHRSNFSRLLAGTEQRFDRK